MRLDKLLPITLAFGVSVVVAQPVPANRDFSTGKKTSVALAVSELFPLVVGAEWRYDLDQKGSKMLAYGFTGGSLNRKVIGYTTYKGREVFHVKSTSVNPPELLQKYPNTTTHITGGNEYWEIRNDGLYLVGQNMTGIIASVKDTFAESVNDAPVRVMRGLIDGENAYLAEKITSRILLNGTQYGVDRTENYITSYTTLASYTPQSAYGNGGDFAVNGIQIKLSGVGAAAYGLALLAPGLMSNGSNPVVVPKVGVALARPDSLLAPVILQSYNIPSSGLVSTDNVTGLHWNPDESGWGINLNQQGKTIFATLFTYDTSGKPMWLVASNLQQGTNGQFSGALYKTRNPTPFQPIKQSDVTQVGSMSIDFWANGFAVITYTVNGIEVSKQIKYQRFGKDRATCTNTNALNRVSATNYQDLWFNPAESGWGVNLTHQDDTIFATLFTYKPSGDATWYVASGMTKQSDGSFTGDLYSTTGSSFNAEEVIPTTGAQVLKVGTASFKPVNGESGEFTHTVDGVTVMKNVQRQVFGASTFVCAKG